MISMDNRQRLLDCALELFSLRGYDAVGVREVVEAAGVTKPTLYHYFDSKRGLLEALLQREAGRLLAEIVPCAVYQGDLVLTLENILRAYFSFVQTHTECYRMQLGMYFSAPESEGNQAIRPYAAIQHQLLEEVFIQAAENHGNLRGRHARYAAAYLGVVNAVIGLYLNEELQLTDELVYQTVHQFMHGIFS
ncbi:MAG: HTH-type transcriptional regulator MtrR [Chloroflexi bacterium ADurb.Bin120]|jgi:AcrR family transcriptional regulator|uniref:TetR family transcriptional regulator n=2 Tax=Candidatus Brevifilum fermentans TaxID=1986204 RepID=A0A1Y6K0N7_9CHLR|nr:MAG: HTH-type transcriptional regulator MtrR [Chloroflexi bacterium ADurb.Bin120]SMX53213.1 TetR family transcriptional regulator [Brevefilum fermentans]